MSAAETTTKVIEVVDKAPTDAKKPAHKAGMNGAKMLAGLAVILALVSARAPRVSLLSRLALMAPP